MAIWNEIKKSRQEDERKSFPVAKLKDRIINDLYLWDMRCWKKPKSRVQAVAWVTKIKMKGPYAKGVTKNCGHVVYCINLLLTLHNKPVSFVVDIVMKNNNIQYKNEIGSWGGWGGWPSSSKILH